MGVGNRINFLRGLGVGGTELENHMEREEREGLWGECRRTEWLELKDI